MHFICQAFASPVFSSGTGVVTSVPSDAPDDIAALRDIKKKQVTFNLISTLQIKSAAEKLGNILTALKGRHSQGIG